MRSDAGSSPRRRGRAWGAAATGLSAALHLAVLGGLILTARGPPPPPPRPAVLIQLLRPPKPPERKQAAHPSPPLKTHAGRTRRVVETPTPPSSPMRLPPPDLGPPVVASVTPVTPPAVRKALRLETGCEHADFLKLGAAEREACARRLATASPRDIAKVFVVSDPRKRAEFDKAANKDEAWRRYRDSTSMDDYPGLHTLLGH